MVEPAIDVCGVCARRFPGIVLTRAFLLTSLCGLAGFLAARLSANFYAGIAAALATASVAVEFAADRPGVISFLGVAVFLCLLEMRRGWWALPPLALVWANCHGGFFLGWVVLLAYSAEALLTRPQDSRKLWLASACAIAASGIIPNGFGVISTILAYRRSPMTANLVEWQAPKLWGAPYGFDILLYAAFVILILSWKKVRLSHWILFAIFAAAALTAFRNIALIGLLAPVLIAAYFPFRVERPRVFAWTSVMLAASGLAVGFAAARLPQLGVAAWNIPRGRRTTCRNTT